MFFAGFCKWLICGTLKSFSGFRNPLPGIPAHLFPLHVWAPGGITSYDGMKEGKSSGPLWSKRVADCIHIQEGVCDSFEGHPEFNTRINSVISSQLSNNQDICVTSPDEKRLAHPSSGHKMYDNTPISFLMIVGIDHDVTRTNMKNTVLSGHQNMSVIIVPGLTCFQRGTQTALSYYLNRRGIVSRVEDHMGLM